MSEESPNLDLEQFTEQVAEQIIFTVSAATGDPKAAIVRVVCLIKIRFFRRKYFRRIAVRSLGKPEHGEKVSRNSATSFFEFSQNAQAMEFSACTSFVRQENVP